MHETATPLAPTTSGARLGERVRTLRVVRGPDADRSSRASASRRSTSARSSAARRVRPSRRSRGSPIGSASIRLPRRPGSRRRSARRSRRRSLAPRRCPRLIGTTTRSRRIASCAPGVEGTGAPVARAARARRARPGHCRRSAQVKEAIDLPAARARARRTGGFSDLDLADVLYRLARLPLQALERLDRDRALRRGARARGAIGPAVRPPALRHPAAALALPSPASRLRRRTRRRRARARARAGARRPRGDRERVLPGVARRRSGRVTTSSRAATRSGRRSSTSS